MAKSKVPSFKDIESALLKKALGYDHDEIVEEYVVDEEGDGDWVHVDMFEFEFYAEDYPDGELTSESVEFTLTGYPKGEYYRLRGAYAAVKDGVIEGFGPSTDGILIE